MRLEDLAALGELPQQHRPQPVQSAAPGQFRGQFGGRVHRVLPDQLDAQPHAEQPEPDEQVLAFELGDRDAAGPRGEPIGGQQQLVGLRARGVGQGGQRPILRFPQGDRGMAQQAGHRHDHRAQPAQPRFGLVALAHPFGDLERVQPAGADLVGAGQHADRVHRGAVGQVVVVERLQEPHVAGVGVPQQVQHGVDDRRPVVLRGQHPQRPGGQIGGDRGDARGVDQGDLGEPAGRPGHLEPVDVRRRARPPVRSRARRPPGCSKRSPAVRAAGRGHLRLLAAAGTR